jgi:hypothetical protein
MPRALPLVIAIALALAACTVSTDRGPGDASSPPPKAGEPSVRAGSPPPTIVVDNLPRGELLSGMLSADSVEGGACPYLETSEGKRFQVVYPAGWRIQRSPLQLVAPDGSVYRRAGDIVTVRGAVTNQIASTCQVGPVFQATEVVDG